MAEEPCWVYPIDSPNFNRKPWNAYNGKVPFILSDLVKAINQKEGFKIKGILREKGKDNEIQEIEKNVDRGIQRTFLDADPLNLGSVLKNYVRCVCEIDQLITDENAKKMINSISTDQDIKDKIKSVKEIINSFDDSHKVSLAYLLSFTYNITQHEESCMTAANIGICLSPTIFQTADPLMTMKNADLIEFLVANFTNIFDASLYSEDKLLTDEEVQNISMPFIETNDVQIEAERRALRSGSKIPIDYEYMDSILGLKYPTSS